MTKIFYHADDFGVTVEQSKSILECYESGVLNSVSIIPNSPEAAKSYELIRTFVDSGKIRLVIHLNFVEGFSLASPSDIPYLVDENGMFKCTYGSMLKLNYSPNHKKGVEQFKKEIAAQISAVCAITGTKKINIDSHQHYLMIPMIWEAFCQVVKENSYELDYLRIPVDPRKPVFSNFSTLAAVPKINFIKWALLGFLAPSKSSINSLGSSIKVPLFFGMPFTCQMTKERIDTLLPKYKAIAEASNLDLELMFHPGQVSEVESLLDSAQEDLVEFYGSDYRQLEKDCLMSL